MIVFFIRHGQSTYNRDRIIQGQSNCPLSDLGISEANKAGECLKKEYTGLVFKAIWSSDLSRAKQTAEIIAKYQKISHIIFSNLLRERHSGKFEGKQERTINQKTWNRFLYRRAEGGETFSEVRARAEKFIDKVSSTYNDNDHILAITHGGFLKMLYSIVNKESIIKSVKIIDIENVSITQLEILPDKSLRLVNIGDTDYLSR